MGKKRKSQKPAKNVDRDDDQMEDDSDEDIFTDEISEFTAARNKVDLDDKEEESEDEEGMFGLLSEEDESDEELGEWSKRLKQIKFQTKIDKQKQRPDAPEKSWGKRRTDFYGSGVHRKPKDPGVEEDDEWVMEEKEVEKLQKRLDEDIDEEDFIVPGLVNKRKDSKGDDLTVARELTDYEKEQYQQLAHPESEALHGELQSCLEKVQQLRGTTGWMVESRDTVYRLLGANIAFYLHLVESGHDTRGHPVLKRILQWKKLAKIYDTIQDSGLSESEDEPERATEDSEPAKRTRLALEDSESDGPEDNLVEEETSLLNRPVTYEIEKNKPKKKSAPNNPRVKHREKFRKAKIRRKGKIRDYRPEVNKYQGEMSGIRTGIVRSVRLM